MLLLKYYYVIIIIIIIIVLVIIIFFILFIINTRLCGRMVRRESVWRASDTGMVPTVPLWGGTGD